MQLAALQLETPRARENAEAPAGDTFYILILVSSNRLLHDLPQTVV